VHLEEPVSDGYDLNKWVPLHQRDMLAVARGEEEIYFLDAKVSGHSSVESLAKLLNDRAALLKALKGILASAEECWRAGCFATLSSTDAERARAAITTAEALL
jgi:hypothetical protein